MLVAQAAFQTPSKPSLRKWRKISAVANDWAQKGAHIKVKGVEIAVRPAQNGRMALKPVFSSTRTKDAQNAIREATDLLDDVGFRQRLYNATARAIEKLGSGDAMSRARAAELRFLAHALKKQGLE